MFSFTYYSILTIVLISNIDSIQQILDAHILLTDMGKIFNPNDARELAWKNLNTSSITDCAIQCNQNIVCRTFVYDEITLSCQLYVSDLTTGNITSSASSTSRVGYIENDQMAYANYNKTCEYCQSSRYLICLNSTCQCPTSVTYWDGTQCKNRLLNGDLCSL